MQEEYKFSKEASVENFKLVKGEISLKTTEQRLIRTLEIYSETESSIKYTNHQNLISTLVLIKNTKKDNIHKKNKYVMTYLPN